MTRNQIDNRQQRADETAKIKRAEQEAANLAETKRSNVARENELRRSNRVNERLEAGGKLLGLGKLIQSSRPNLKDLASVLGNDPAWYNKNRAMVDSAANLSFFTPLRGIINGSNTKTDRASVLALNWVPALGGDYITSSGLRTNPVQTAAQVLYSWVRHANSGSANYEPVDLIMYLLAMDSAYTLYAFGRMIYRMCLSFSTWDIGYPEAWFKATEVDRTSFSTNLADFRYYLETVAAQLNALYVPSEFPYFNRHIWMVSNLFKDVDSDKTVYYYYRLAKYGVYNDAEGKIDFVQMPVELTLNSFKAAMNSVLNAIFTSEDIGIIGGDIRKAFGDALFRIESTPSDDVATPFYSEEVLNQINNTYFVGDVKAEDCCIYQEVVDGKSYIFQGMKSTSPDVPSRRVIKVKSLSVNNYDIPDVLINLSYLNPTPDQVMVSTRNMATIATSSGEETYDYISACGSEFFTSGNLAYATLDSTGVSVFHTISVYTRNANMATSLVSLLAQLDWAPHISMFSSGTVSYLAYDLENYTFIDDEHLRNMHITALLSQFNVQTIGLSTATKAKFGK